MSAVPLVPPFPPLGDLDPDADGKAGRAPDWFQLWLAVRDERPRPIRYPAESRRIMVGVDFSPASDAALSLVAGIAATTQTVVDLIHVFDGFDEAFRRGNPAILERVDAVLASVGRALRQRALATAARGVRCVSTSLVGAPGLELTRHADETGADLLVLGLGLVETRGPVGRAWSRAAAAQVLRGGRWRQQRPITSGFAPHPLR